MHRPASVSRIPLIAVLAFSLAGMPGAALAGPASHDAAAARGGPTFLTGPRQGDALELAMDYLRAQRTEMGLRVSDIADVAVTDRYTDAHNGVTHIYLRQRYRGIEIFGANVNINVARDGSIINLGGSFVSNLAAAAGGQAPGRDAAASVRSAARQLGFRAPASLAVKQVRGGQAQSIVFERNGISLEPITAKLVYHITDAQRLRLAWQIELYQPDGDHWWNLRVDAQSGAILARSDYGSHADDAYSVFAIPSESPNEGDRTSVLNPADAAASPYGWHDTNGAAGAEFTTTQGNNVHAYTDTNADNVVDPGSSPDGGPSLEFEFPLDLTQEPPTYRPAAVTNLFYWNNIIHDVMYGYGFTEEAGNFQVNNYGNPGLAGDDVRAEAQDGSSLNNANFFTPVDGMRPRMQMFEWTPPVTVTVNSPEAIAGDYAAGSAAFGPQIKTVGPITDDVVYIGRGCDPAYQTAVPPIPLDPYLADPADKIALIDRGVCTFTSKVKKAQDNGAVAVIVANTAGLPAFGMAGVDPTITIPSVGVANTTGTAMKDNMPVNATLSAAGTINRDSDLDNGVIIHEYGHGISNRLTGGPSNVTCLQNQEQMGEGWSDWFALTLTAVSADVSTTPRGIGAYVNFQGAEGAGIRPTPYTTDMTVNGRTYGSLVTEVPAGILTVPHGVGYVWASMLWEVYWNLVDKHGFNPDVYEPWTSGGNNLAIQLVMDGLKIQQCSPGFVDGRNAILLADQALTFGANQCEIWQGFAKRGLGYSAAQGSSNSVADGTQAFDLPPTCENFTGFAGAVQDPPALNTAKAGSTLPAEFSLSGDQGLAIFAADYPKSGRVDCGTLAPLGTLSSTATPPDNALSYNPATDRYTYPWKTEKAWAGTCRALVLRFTDGVNELAYVRFRP
jgi:extracellular elastinolytic metalloproteinase